MFIDYFSQCLADRTQDLVFKCNNTVIEIVLVTAQRKNMEKKVPFEQLL